MLVRVGVEAWVGDSFNGIDREACAVESLWMIMRWVTLGVLVAYAQLRLRAIENGKCVHNLELQPLLIYTFVKFCLILSVRGVAVKMNH